jgi:hypothetical protein
MGDEVSAHVRAVIPHTAIFEFTHANFQVCDALAQRLHLCFNVSTYCRQKGFSEPSTIIVVRLAFDRGNTSGDIMGSLIKSASSSAGPPWCPPRSAY